MRRHEKYDRLIAKASGISAIPTAVAHPFDETSLKGVPDAAAAGIDALADVPAMVRGKKGTLIDRNFENIAWHR